MAEVAESSTPPGIAALPPTTVRQIGSHQLLTDPSSVVKELIDNALDARAKSIFVDITTNTIDFIQVKDDGHGIPGEDRALACRRYCTSKIRDFHDLKEVGGKWLGFRGEALASIADMSGTVSIMTRVEGEPVAVKLTYQRNGELTSTERDSHPVGTTVKVTNLLESAKVRKELAIKSSTKCLVKIRRLMQAYALARPAIRFRLHILKTKNNKGDFVYAPKANANVKDAVLKIFGKECALQCDWTALEMNGFELHAFLPKPNAAGPRVANQGAFISVESRPVSATRGTLKKIATAVRDRLRKANTTLTNVKDPFFCLNVICPVDSYDPNIEPAKDDVIFIDESFILALVDRLLVSYYPENTVNPESVEDSEPEEVIAVQPIQKINLEEPPTPFYTPSLTLEDTPVQSYGLSSSTMNSQQPHWRSSMYGIDEEDLGCLQEDAPPEIEEEDGRRDVSISNPWTIARMNAPVKSKKPISNNQLPSPAKSQGDTSPARPSPATTTTPCRTRPIEPLTPGMSPPINAHSSRLDDGLQRSIQHIPRPDALDNPPLIDRAPALPSFEENMSPAFVRPALQSPFSNSPVSNSAAPRRTKTASQSVRNRPFVPPVSHSSDTWFGQPMRNAPKAARTQKRPRHQGIPLVPNGDTFSLQRSLILPAAERLVEARLTSENNTDIHDFFGQSRHAPFDISLSTQSRSSSPQHIADQLRVYAERESFARSSPCRPRSADSCQRPMDTGREMNALFDFHQGAPPASASSPVRKARPPIIGSGSTPTARLRRRRTTDGGPYRAKSSTFPLNFVPYGFEVQNLSLKLDTNVSSVVLQARKLDMSANTLEWGYDTADAYDVFATTISERKIMDWVVKVDDMLHATFKRVDGVEVRGSLHEGIQRFLDARRGDEDDRAVAIISAEVPALDESGTARDILSVHTLPTRGLPQSESHRAVQSEKACVNADPAFREECVTAGATAESDEFEEDFDVSQFVDLDSQVEKQGSPVRHVKPEDDFGDGIEDEMLMDL